ncbi:hypothetical protein AQI95_15995 [Streptomyces yokosukanensis]|uniref:Uncharacterized protein n=1 Tax=Streptomyces yokosukanensis TaxID=67386 RepID=A0A101P5T3_9ACTN|nr:DUF6578 domain-containing protein [Streptomyces yokosukanensis]KUN05432.1 hypothetical protein AQI95_15995 [Streptomyces yokosukanensis]
MARIRVFYEDWQMECCGTPFAVGDEVVWKLVAVDGKDARGAYHGAGAWVENHGGPDHGTTGRVRSVDLVHQEYLAHHDPRTAAPRDTAPGKVTLRAAGRALEPVPGAHTLEPVDDCPKWFTAYEDEDHEDHEDGERPPRQVPYRVRRAVGALVTLEVTEAADGTPPKPGDPR